MLGFLPLSVFPLSALPGAQIQGEQDPTRLFAVAGDTKVTLTWIIDPGHVYSELWLRRSADAAPTEPDQGDLVFSGIANGYVDTDVVNGTRYYYTLFEITTTDPVAILPYTPLASADAMPRRIEVSAVHAVEYVPKRGEFGRGIAYPLPDVSAMVWGQLTASGRSDKDMIATRSGSRVAAPVSGVISTIASGDNGLKIMVIDSDAGGLRFTIGQVSPAADAVVGHRVKAGDAVATTGAQLVEFAIDKLPTGRFGLRTVRASYFYLAVESRDGRR